VTDPTAENKRSKYLYTLHLQQTEDIKVCKEPNKGKKERPKGLHRRSQPKERL